MLKNTVVFFVFGVFFGRVGVLIYFLTSVLQDLKPYFILKNFAEQQLDYVAEYNYSSKTNKYEAGSLFL